MRQVTGRLFWGAVAGGLVWILFEPFAPKIGGDWDTYSRNLVLALGASIGLILGAYNGLMRGGGRKLAFGAGLGLLFGLIGALMGVGIAGVVDKAFPGVTNGHAAIATVILARVLGLTPIGLMIGLGVGASGLTVRRAFVGALGGMIAGAIAGFLFDIISALLAAAQFAVKATGEQEIGAPGRAVFCLLIGAGIGLFTGLLDRIVRSAWLRLMLGRNEGRDWVIESTQTSIGRSESATVSLFGDPSVMPIHAMITRQGDQYILSDGGSQVGTFVNGQPIHQVPLFHGAQIRIGMHTLQFSMKNAAAPQAVYADPYQAQAMQQHMQQPVSPYAQTMVPQPAGFPQQPAAMMPGQPTVAYPQPGSPTVAYPQAAPQSTAAVARPLELVATAGPLAGQRFPVAGPMEAGREASGIGLSFDSMASRRHASFAPVPGGISVTDLGSTNGTFINDRQVQSGVVGKGDTVRIGVSTFRIE